MFCKSILFAGRFSSVHVRDAFVPEAGQNHLSVDESLAELSLIDQLLRTKLSMAGPGLCAGEERGIEGLKPKRSARPAPSARKMFQQEGGQASRPHQPLLQSRIPAFPCTSLLPTASLQVCPERVGKMPRSSFKCSPRPNEQDHQGSGTLS